MKKIKVIALMGEAGAGKDYILHEAMEEDKDKNAFHEIVSCTSRPPREGEVDGINYHFLSKEYIEAHESDFLELSTFRGWYYGTRYCDLNPDKINVGVFNPAGVRSLLKSDKIDLRVFWVKAPAKTRLIRQLERETNPDIGEIIRRYQADINDFCTIDFPYEELDNS